MTSPLVSVIMPAYNSAQYIAKSLESIQKQTLKDWECIIADDLSTDATVKIVKEISNIDSRIHIINCPQKMFTALARNESIAKAKGRYLCFLDSDDLWHPKKLEKQVSFMKEKDIAFSFHSYQFINESNKTIKQIVKAPEIVSHRDLLKANPIGCLTVMYDTKKLGKILMLDGFHTREDYVCWLEILKKIPYAYGIQENLAYYRVHPSGSSSSKIKAAKSQWNVYRKYLKLPLTKSVLNMFQYAYRGVKKHGHL